MSTTVKKPGLRKERVGIVVSDCQEKSIIIKVDRKTAHKKYKKVMVKSKKYHVHDEKNEAKIGDIVEVIESRPISKLKNWRLGRIVRKAGVQAGE